MNPRPRFLTRLSRAAISVVHASKEKERLGRADQYRFYPSGRKSSHLRVSVSIIEKADADLGLSRLAEAIREAKEAAAVPKANGA